MYEHGHTLAGDRLDQPLERGPVVSDGEDGPGHRRECGGVADQHGHCSGAGRSRDELTPVLSMTL